MARAFAGQAEGYGFGSRRLYVGAGSPGEGYPCLRQLLLSSRQDARHRSHGAVGSALP